MSDDQARRPGESFLAHRARLKAERQSEPQLPINAETEAAPPASVDTEPEAPERPLTDADMPPLESLTAESDFTQFLAEGVSDALRRAALRKLFHLPEFNILDGLNDYDEDYTNFEKLGDVITYHQHRMRAREEAEKAAAERDAQQAEETGETKQAQAEGGGDEVKTADVHAAVENPASGTASEPLDDDGDLEA